MSKIRKWLIMVLIFVLTTGMCFAGGIDKEENEEQVLIPAYVVLNELKITPQISSDIATVKVDAKVVNGSADSAVVRITLEKKNGSNYTVVKTWRDQNMSINAAGSGSITRSHQLTETGTYRFKMSGSFYKNGILVETIGDHYSNLITYSE